jgi:hypothetical protein
VRTVNRLIALTRKTLPGPHFGYAAPDIEAVRLGMGPHMTLQKDRLETTAALAAARPVPIASSR